MSEEDAANKVPILLQRYNEQKVLFIARKFVIFVRFEEKEDASHTKSAVWEFFNRRSNTEAVCECCHTLIARKTNSTHSLWKHLKEEHPDEHKTAEQKRDEAATERRKIATTVKANC